MSDVNQMQELRDELRCAICLESFKNPVNLQCGHSYCQACITNCWKAPGTRVCPQCRTSFPERELRPNKPLEAVAHLAETLDEQCKKHAEVFTHFCKAERTLICSVCKESREHRAHPVVPIQEAAKEYKEQLLRHQNRFQHAREERGRRAAAEERKYQTLLEETKSQKQEVVSEVKQVYQILKLGAQLMWNHLESIIEDLEEEKKKKNTNRCSEGILLLDNILAEINQKCQQQGIELLKGIDCTLIRCEQVKGEEEAPAEPLTELESGVQALPESQKALRELLQNIRELAPQLGLPESISSEVQRQVSGEDPLEDEPNDPNQEDTSVCLLDCEDGECSSDSCEKQEVDSTDKQNNLTDSINVDPEEIIDSLPNPVPDISFTNNSATIHLLHSDHVVHHSPGQWPDPKCRRRCRWEMPAAVAVLLAVILIPVMAWSVSKASVTPPHSPVTACCPEKWIGYHGKCYLFSEEEANWTSSQQFCSSPGASLAGLDTLQEKDFLMQHRGYIDAWIGLRRVPGQPWKWPNGSVFSHLFQIGGVGECTFIYKNTISSSKCYTMRHYICSKPDELAKRKIT